MNKPKQQTKSIAWLDQHPDFRNNGEICCETSVVLDALEKSAFQAVLITTEFGAIEISNESAITLLTNEGKYASSSFSSICVTTIINSSLGGYNICLEYPCT